MSDLQRKMTLVYLLLMEGFIAVFNKNTVNQQGNYESSVEN